MLRAVVGAVQGCIKPVPGNHEYMHHPRFSSGEKHGSTAGGVKKLWEALYEANTEVVLSGHEHNYERFAPQGRVDPERGIRQFVVGTGGGKYPIGDPIENTEVYNGETDSVLRLKLDVNPYGWEFVPVEGESFTDSGRTRCN
jgi:acid phosphatase type 7